MTNTILQPKGRLRRQWNMMFLLSCVIALTLDPLFLYVPVINKDNKCLAFDKGLMIIAIGFRSLTDMIYVANIILQFISPYKNESLHGAGGNELVTDAWLIAKRYLLSYFLMDILAILPLPQVNIYICLIFNVILHKLFKFQNSLTARVFEYYCELYDTDHHYLQPQVVKGLGLRA